MKKFISLMLVFVLVLGSIAVFTACDSSDDKNPSKTEEVTTAATTEATTAETTAATTAAATTAAATTGVVIPDDYTLYKNNDISFAYPEGWVKTDASVVTIQNTENSNNITVAYEAKTDIYKNMTVDSFNNTIKPVYDSLGMAVSNVKVSHKTNNGIEITVISHNTTVNSTTMKQTQYILNSGSRTYTVTVTEAVADSELVENVLKTLILVG